MLPPSLKASSLSLTSPLRARNTASPGSADTNRHDRLSPVDLPYTSEVFSSLPPSSPAPESRSPQDANISQTTGNLAEHHASISIRRPSSADDLNPLEMVGVRFFPMSLKGILRYEKPGRILPSEGDHIIRAMTYECPKKRNVPLGWTACQHPDGAQYFVHDESKTFTEANICDVDIFEDIEYFRVFLYSELHAEIKSRELSHLDTDEVELVVEPKIDEIGVICCYYFVSPGTRTLFWLDEWCAYEVFGGVNGISPHHKGLAIQAQYWSHCCLYPNFFRISQALKDEVLGMIVHAMSNHLISGRSASPLNSLELGNHLSLIKCIDPTVSSQHAQSTIVIARVMHIFYDNYFSNFHGEKCARLTFDQTIHGWRYCPSLLMTICAPLLFMIPVNRVRVLHQIFVDGVANKEWWNAFILRFNSRLQASNLLATVLLNINIGLLPKQSGPVTSIQQFFINMSMVSSLASIILGLIFMGQNRTEEPNASFKIANFLRGLQHEKHGLEILAIAWSLPHAFLMWSVTFFVASFVVQWYYPASTTSRVIVGCFMILTAFLATWCIRIVRDRRDFWWFQPHPSEVDGPTEDDDDKGDTKLAFLYGTVASLTRVLKIPKSRRHARSTI